MRSYWVILMFTRDVQHGVILGGSDNKQDAWTLADHYSREWPDDTTRIRLVECQAPTWGEVWK